MYYLDSTVSDWTEVGHSDQGTGNLSPELGFWVWQNDGCDYTGTHQVAFSNFIVVSGNVFVIPELPFGPILGARAVGNGD